MTEYQNTVIDRTGRHVDDTEENILHDLERYTLDPVFEMYGDFVNPAPEWLDEARAAKYAGCTTIFGNFLTYSHAFRVVTDDAVLIARIAAAVERNKATPEYKVAREKMIARLPTLTKDSKQIGRCYQFAGGWMKLTRVYRITEQEANENALLCLERFEGVTDIGHTVGGALPGGDTLPTTKNWKL